MEREEIRRRFDIALKNFLESDNYLLNSNISERAIAHKLAEKLQIQFTEYHVDCEYNGDVDNHDNKKHIHILRDRIVEIKGLKEWERDLNDIEVLSRSVYPDIIVHKRGSNDYNILIIEIKKSNSYISKSYDDLKLRSYTSEEHGNTLKYSLGIFIEFNIRDGGINELSFYQEGAEIALQ